MKKWVKLKDLYLLYPHKTWKKAGNTIPIPYIKKTERSTHDYAVTFTEWKAIVQTYLKIVLQDIFTGVEFDVPRGLGVIKMFKKRCKSVDRIKSAKQQKLVLSNSVHLMGYKPRIKWLRWGFSVAQHRDMWTFNLTRGGSWRQWYKEFKVNPSILFMYPTVFKD